MRQKFEIWFYSGLAAAIGVSIGYWYAASTAAEMFKTGIAR